MVSPTTNLNQFFLPNEDATTLKGPWEIKWKYVHCWRHWWKEGIDSQSFHTKVLRLWDMGSWAPQILMLLKIFGYGQWVMVLKVFEIQFLLETFCPFFSRIQQAMKLLSLQNLTIFLNKHKKWPRKHWKWPRQDKKCIH